MLIRNRVRELRMVRASELVPNLKNWRKHPPAQAEALRGLLSEIGYSDVLLARETADGRLMLIDGHLKLAAQARISLICGQTANGEGLGGGAR